jgi:hypothetical protein
LADLSKLGGVLEAKFEFFQYLMSVGEEKSVEAEFDLEIFETIHLTQAALGPKPSKGAHTLMIHKDGEIAC